MENSRVKLYTGDLVIRVLLTVLRLLLPYTIFGALVLKGQISQELANSMVWAIMIGQLMYYSTSRRLHQIIRDEIKSGDVVIRLSEPVNYIGAKIWQSLGYFVPTFLVLVLVFYTGLSVVIPSPISLAKLLVFAFLGFLIINLINSIVGLTSFLIEENDGVFWITSKLFLIFGNQIIPVALMPERVVRAFQATPFFLGMAGPAEVASGRMDARLALVYCLINIAVLIWINGWLLNGLRKKVVING